MASRGSHVAGGGSFETKASNKFCRPDRKCYNNIPVLTAREYGYPYNLGKAQTQSIDYLIKARYRQATTLYSKDLYAHFGCINAIEFSINGRLMVSGGDDRRVLLWNVEKALSARDTPIVMQAEHTSNIFCLGLDSENRRIFSGGNDEQVIIHDVETREPLKVIPHQDVVYCLSVDPQNDNLFATACDEGRILLLDIRQSYNLDNLPVLIRTRSAYHAVMHNPIEPRLIVTANSRDGVSLWDLRNTRVDLIKYNGGLVTSQSAMSVRFNSTGTKIFALRRRLPAILYNTMSPHPIAEFDHKDYYNSCTMKSCCFGGTNDEYVLSGSDDFRLYMWKIPDEVMEKDYSSDGIKWVDQTHLVLRGHRSIVNQVRYNYSNATIASSGVEKVIKVWSIFDVFDHHDAKQNVKNHDNRKVYTHEEYIQLVLESGQFSAHDYSNQSIKEDPRMMAFFDSLVQRDIEGLTTDSNSEGESDFAARFAAHNKPTRNHAIINSQSDLSPRSDSEDENELVYICDDQIVNYIKSFSERMESSVNRLYRNSSSQPVVTNNDNNNIDDSNSNVGVSNVTSEPYNSGISCEPSTSFAGPSSSSSGQMASTSSANSHSVTSNQTNDTTTNGNNGDIDTNKISLLINDKKKDQLRKVTRCALRSTRIRLRKLEKYLAREEDRSNGSAAGTSRSSVSLEDKARLKKQLEDILIILERLSSKIECKSNRIQRLMIRLRYLTSRSMWGGIPDPALVFDSDDDNPFLGGVDILNEVRMAHRLANLADIFNVPNDGLYPNGGRLDDTDDDPCLVDRSDIDTDSIATFSSKSSVSQIKSPDASSGSSDDDGSSSSSSSSSGSSRSFASQIYSPDLEKSKVKSPGNSSSSSSDDERDRNKIKRRRRKGERKRAKLPVDKSSKPMKSKKYIDSSDEDDDSSSESSDTSSEPNSKTIKYPRPIIIYGEDEDDGFEGDTESKSRLNCAPAVKSNQSKESTTNSNNIQTDCQQPTTSTKLTETTADDEDNDDNQQQPIVLEEDNLNENVSQLIDNVNSSSSIEPSEHTEHIENAKPVESNTTFDSTFKTVDNCHRKRKIFDPTNESHIFKSIKRKSD